MSPDVNFTPRPEDQPTIAPVTVMQPGVAATPAAMPQAGLSGTLEYSPAATNPAAVATTPLINQPGFSAPPASTPPTAHSLASEIPKPSKKAWASVSFAIVLLALGTLVVMNRPNKPNQMSNQTPTGTSAQLGNIKADSVTFGIDTKIANGKTLTATGPVIIQNTANSASALQVQNAAGDNLLVADTANNVVGIGTTPVAGGAALQVGGNIAASGSISANGGATRLDNKGLTINNVLICTSSGCQNLAAQAASGRVFTGDASTLNGQPGSYYKNASNINSGTLADSRLSRNVALLASSQTFTGINSFTSAGNTFVGDGSGLSAVDAAKLNGQGASYYTNASNLSSGTLSDSRLSGNITKQGNTFNGASQLVMLDSNGLLPVLDGSALTNLNASEVNIGTISDSRLSANVTLAGNAFNGANQLVQLNASGDLPALSGINLTNINASAISTGTVNDLRLSPNVTLQGNTFNGASQLVQLTNQAYFPALNGSLIANLDASNISSGTLNDNRLSANVALLGASSQTFSGNNTFSSVIDAPGLETVNSGHTVGIGFSGTATGNVSYNFDVAAAPGTYSVCTTAGNCAGPSGGVTSTGGTLNQLAKFSGGQTIVDSIISDDGSTVTVSGNLAANNITQNGNGVCDVSGNCAGVGGQVGGTGTTDKIALFSGASTIGDSVISQSGTTIGVGGSINITGQYQLNGSQISSAALSNAADIALLDGNQTFSGNNLFTGGVQVQPASDSTTALLVTNHAGNNNVLTVDTVNGRLGVGVQPGYTLDVSGDINISTGSSYRINGVAICGPSATCAPSSGSNNYIQNSVSQQNNANLNIRSVNNGSIVANFEGASGQTADLIRAQDGNGANVFHVDPSGNVNITGQYQINGSPICTTSGCTAASGSGNYIQNGTSLQTANFNITGSGALGSLAVQSSTNSTTAFRLQNAGGISLITGDTTNLKVSTTQLQATSTIASYSGGANAQLSWNLLSSTGLTMSGNEITDSVRRAAIQGDGQTAPDSSTGIWEATTNLIANGGFETDLSGWSSQRSATLSKDTSAFKFGAASLLVTTPGSTNSEGALYNSVNVSAGTAYTLSAWIKGASGELLCTQAEDRGGTTTDHNQCFTATGSWQRIVNTFTTVSGTTTVIPGIFTSGTHAYSYWVDGVQLEQKAYATPYVETNGTTASRSAARVQAPISGLTATKGWVAMRVRLGQVSNGFRTFEIGSSSNQLTGSWVTGVSSWQMLRSNGTQDTVRIAASPATGDLVTLIFTWDSSTIGLSVNGSAFTTASSPDIPAISPTLMDLGSDVGSASWLDGDILWTAAGTGSLSNTDAATLNSYGSSDPALSNLTTLNSGAATPTMVWNGTTSSYSSSTGTVLQSALNLDDASLYRSAANTLATNSNFLLQNSTNSTTAFQIQNASATGVFDVDTVNGRVGIGTATPGQKLDVNGSIRVASSNFISWGASDSIKIQDAGSNVLSMYTAGTLQTSLDASGNFILSGNGLLVMGIKTSDPACTNGATYYNSTTNTFRGCANGVWNDFSMGSSMPVGTMQAYAGATAPSGYFIADGSPVSRTAYSALFAVIGTTYGAGDGSTTFNLPDMRGRDAIGLGTNADVNTLGENDGSALASRTPRHNSTYNSPSISRSADVILNDPGHTHTYNEPTGSSGGFGGSTSTPSGIGVGTTSLSYTGITVSQQPNFVLSGGSVGPGGSRPTDTAAYLTVNYIIKY